MRIAIFTVDAFTTQQFTGNPAAVCLPEVQLPDDTMQMIAAEMRLSETCFVSPITREENSTDAAKDEDEYTIRWFTPTNEVNLCGHATLAAAHVLFNVRSVPSKPCLVFITKDMLKLTVRLDANKRIAMNFPCYPPVKVADEKALSKLEKLITPILLKSAQETNCNITSVYWSAETKKVFFLLSDEVVLESLEFSNNDLEHWLTMDLPYPVRGVCITKRGASPNTYETRYFSPWNGIGEDPVNGSSHTVLGPLWRSLEAMEGSGEPSLLFQSWIRSPRGGEMWVSVSENNSEVELKGSAVVFMSGDLHL